MELIAGGINNQWLRDLTSTCTPMCSEVKAAIAYASVDNMLLLESCNSNRKILTFYGRYDESVPVHPDIIQWFLRQASPNYICRVVPDILHSKIIWWLDVGAYIGSANMTERAWHSNIEAGIFLTHDELKEKSLDHELSNFFEKTHQNSEAISKEFHSHLLALVNSKKSVDKANFDHKKRTRRFFPENSGLLDDSGTPEGNINFQTFEREWRESIQFLRDIGKRLNRPENRPHWVSEETPEGAHVDQFIHAYYYQYIQGGRGVENIKIANKHNRLNPENALSEAINWWKESDFDYSEEKIHLDQWAKLLRESFARGNVTKLNEDEFIAAMSCVHAVRQAARHRKNQTLGLPDDRQDHKIKITAHLRQIWKIKTKEGRTILDLLDYVIWGNGPVEHRIWSAVNMDRWTFPQIGYSTLGELLGWARPSDYPPRNNRTLKGLYSLGYPVNLPTDKDD